MKVNLTDYLVAEEKTAFRTLLVLFAQALGGRFDEKCEQGKRGWAGGDRDPDLKGRLWAALRQNVDEGDMVDVAVLAAMIWNLQDDDRVPQQKLEINVSGRVGL